MKKIVSILFVILMLCSCAAVIPEAENLQNENNSDISEKAETAEWSVDISIKNVTPKGATLVLEKVGGTPADELSTGSYYRIENSGGVLPYIFDGDASWTAVAYVIPESGELEIEVNWEGLYGVLEPGTYRIFKNVGNDSDPGDLIKICSVEFKVE